MCVTRSEWMCLCVRARACVRVRVCVCACKSVGQMDKMTNRTISIYYWKNREMVGGLIYTNVLYLINTNKFTLLSQHDRIA